jgi:uncharacterized membrane protein
LWHHQLPLLRGANTDMAEPADPPQVIQTSRRGQLLSRLRNYFLTGLVIAAPLFLTVYITRTFVEWIDGMVVPLIPTAYRFDQRLPFAIPGFGLLVALVFITILGFLTANFIGRRLLQAGESLLGRMPIIRNLYGGLKQVFETVISRPANAFKQVALIEYPRPGTWSMVFIAADARGQIGDQVMGGGGESDDGDDAVSVFLPTSPNPTNGFLLFVKRSDLVVLDLTIEEAAKMIISAGLLSPELVADRHAKEEDTRAARRLKRFKASPAPDYPAPSSLTASSRPKR